MWYLILILCHIGIKINVVSAIILIISWWAITITIYQITFRHDEKNVNSVKRNTMKNIFPI